MQNIFGFLTALKKLILLRLENIILGYSEYVNLVTTKNEFQNGQDIKCNDYL